MAAIRTTLEATTAKTTTTNTTITSRQMHNNKTTTNTAASMGMGVEFQVDTTRAMATQAMRALMEAEAFHRWDTVQGRAAMDIEVVPYPAGEKRAPALKRRSRCQRTSDGQGLNAAPG